MSNLQKRKNLRLREYDYSTPGAYFITICTENRRRILGNLVGHDACDVPKIELSSYGNTLDKYIVFLSEKYDHIRVDKYVIMPDHFHLLLRITEKPMSGGVSQTSRPTKSEVAKFVSLLKRYCNKEYGENIWQTSYNDHIIRNEKDYLEIIEYIDNNPLRLKLGYSKNNKRKEGQI